MRRIVIAGLVALAATLGGVAVPVSAATDRPARAVRPAGALRPAALGLQPNVAPRISCVTARDCLAIAGTSAQSAGAAPVAMAIARWNGSRWTRARAALPRGTRSVDLAGVSCRTATSCLVVGDYYTSAGSGASSHALALTYNGTSLRPLPAVPLPRSATQATLSGVSCTTAAHCVAVGAAVGSSSGFSPNGPDSLIETWNGTKWTLRSVGAPAGTLVDFTGVSCVTSAYCVLAGTAFAQNGVHLYLRSWNGRQLAVMKTAGESSTGGLLVTGVSCATRANCAVSGGAVSAASGDISAFTRVWKGQAWQASTAAWPTGTADSYLAGVSCFGAHDCEAVGLAGSIAAPGPAAVFFNGTSWTRQAVPGPGRGRATILADVSCLSAASCVAVGDTGPVSTTTPARLTGVWNGRTWRFLPGF